MKLPWKNMEANQKPWKTMKPPWKTMETNQNPWNYLEKPWKPTKNHEKPWNYHVNHGNQPETMKLPCKPWKPTKNLKKPWNYLGKPWKPTKNHKKPWNYLEKPWKPTKKHEITLEITWQGNAMIGIASDKKLWCATRCSYFEVWGVGDHIKTLEGSSASVCTNLSISPRLEMTFFSELHLSKKMPSLFNIS